MDDVFKEFSTIRLKQSNVISETKQKDGFIYWVKFQISPICDEAGKAIIPHLKKVIQNLKKGIYRVFDNIRLQ